MPAPIAQKFMSRGVGNGFPVCLEKVDVSGFTYTAPMTLAQASKVYWNLYSVTASASVTSGISPFDLSVANPNIDTRLANGVDQNPVGYEIGDREPVKRICNVFGGGFEFESDDINFNAADVRFTSIGGISRMYNGATTDEDNFIGYGFGNDSSATEISVARAGGDAGTVGAREAIYSWAELSSDPSGWWMNYSVMSTPDTVIETTISGIPLVKATWTSLIGIGSNAAASITGLTFYTYPPA